MPYNENRSHSYLLQVRDLIGERLRENLKSSLSELHELVARSLGDYGQRYTTNRRLLVEILAAATKPLGISEITVSGLGSDRNLPVSSTYRNLAILEECGVLRKLAGPNEQVRYELSEELTGIHHHHLVCYGCGRVDDFSLGYKLEKAIGDAVRAISHEYNFQVTEHRVDFVGRCIVCVG